MHDRRSSGSWRTPVARSGPRTFGGSQRGAAISGSLRVFPPGFIWAEPGDGVAVLTGVVSLGRERADGVGTDGLCL